ncbi:MAG TPA: hypothetical protein VHC69_29135 [Polyangiaceae bacterium]|nr:hypothetical protein [Polyangiaceae bacterium]
MKHVASIVIASVSACVGLSLARSAVSDVPPEQVQVEAAAAPAPSATNGSTALYAGYVHRQEQTSFDPSFVSDIGTLALSPQSKLNTYFVGRLQRTEGPRGIWAFDQVSGWSGASPSPAVMNEVRPYGATLEEHNAKVKTYFVAAGLPADQIGQVAGTAQVIESGPTDHWDKHTTRLRAYTTILRRAINGVVIGDSMASASLADSGRAIRESVFWPSVPQSVVTDAKTMMATLAADGMASFRAKLPSDVEVSDGGIQVVVRHQSESYAGTPYSRAVVEVMTKDGAVRVFDSAASEIHLPGPR